MRQPDSESETVGKPQTAGVVAPVVVAQAGEMALEPVALVQGLENLEPVRLTSTSRSWGQTC